MVDQLPVGYDYVFGVHLQVHLAGGVGNVPEIEGSGHFMLFGSSHTDLSDWSHSRKKWFDVKLV